MRAAGVLHNGANRGDHYKEGSRGPASPVRALHSCSSPPIPGAGSELGLRHEAPPPDPRGTRLEEAQLVEGLRQRSDDAVRCYLERYRSLFFHCIGHFEQDPGRRDELFNDLALHAIERLDRDRFDPLRGSFGTWLYRVAWCRSVDLQRRANARRRVKLTSGMEELPERADARPDPGLSASTAEIGERVRAALGELEPQERSLLKLRHADELTLQEVAHELGITVEQTKYRLKRALFHMRRALLARLPREEVLE